MTSDYQKEMRFGNLLVQLGLLSETDLSEVAQLAIEVGLPLGKVLVMSDFITETQLQALVQAQSMLKDRVLSLEVASRALQLLSHQTMTWVEALERAGWQPPQVLPANKLGKLLVDADVITAEELEKALIYARDSNLPLGRVLLLSKRISEQLLYSCLNAQVLLRDGKISRAQTLAALKAANARQAPVEQVLADVGLQSGFKNRIKLGEMFVLAGILNEATIMDVIERGLVNEKPVGNVLLESGLVTTNQLDTALQLQQMVDEGTLTPIRAADIFKHINTHGLSIEEATAGIGAMREAGGAQMTLADLLKVAGVLTEDDLQEAFRRSISNPALLGKILMMTGFIDEEAVNAAMQVQQFANQGALRRDQAIIVLTYCLRLHCSLEQALQDLGWTPKKKGPSRKEVASASAQTASEWYG